MTQRDNYLDAVALLEAVDNDDTQALATIDEHADHAGIIAALCDITLGTGSTWTGTPGDATIYLARLRAQVMADTTDE